MLGREPYKTGIVHSLLIFHLFINDPFLNDIERPAFYLEEYTQHIFAYNAKRNKLHTTEKNNGEKQSSKPLRDIAVNIFFNDAVYQVYERNGNGNKPEVCNQLNRKFTEIKNTV